VLAILATVAGLTGAALSYQDLVNERAVLKRDWRVGVSAATLLWSKAVVHGAFSGVLAAMMTTLYAAARDLPDTRFGLPPGPAMFVALSGIMLSSTGLGLLISAISDSAERAVTWNTLLAVVQVALSGALFQLPFALHLLSPVIPTRLGLGALASYAGLNEARSAAGLYTDPLWRPAGLFFWLLLLATGVLFVGSTFVAIWKTERDWRRGEDCRRVIRP
jgi:ABC transport system ATP-binding/permease protein